MLNSQIKDLTELTAVTLTDVIEVQHDPAGTPSDGKMQLGTLLSGKGSSPDGDIRRLIYHPGDTLPPDWTMASSGTPNAQIAGWTAYQAYQDINIARNAAEDISSVLTTPTGTYPGSYAFIGGVLLPDGRVFCVPYTSTSARIYRPRLICHPPSWRVLTSPFNNKL